MAQPSQPSKPQDFITAAKGIVNVANSEVVFERRWLSAFGALPAVCCILWDKIDPFRTLPNGVHFKHLLWALYFLQVYDTEENSAKAVGGVDETTYREWSYRFVEAISYLECQVVSGPALDFCLFVCQNLLILLLEDPLGK